MESLFRAVPFLKIRFLGGVGNKWLQSLNSFILLFFRDAKTACCQLRILLLKETVSMARQWQKSLFLQSLHSSNVWLQLSGLIILQKMQTGDLIGPEFFLIKSIVAIIILSLTWKSVKTGEASGSLGSESVLLVIGSDSMRLVRLV